MAHHLLKEEFKDNRGVIRIHKSKKDRQHDDKKIKCKTRNPTLFHDKTSNRIKRQIGTPNTPMSDMLLSWLGTVTSITID
jgi:hypothetical protein